MALQEARCMNASPANLTVHVDDEVVWVKITGRAGCTCSVDFRKLIYGLREKGWRRFVLDLTECQLMDSTFLGVLAGIGLRFSEEQAAANGNAATIELVNPSDRVSGLLENLGVAQLFTVSHRAAPAVDDDKAVDVVEAGETNRTEMQRTSLEAHRLLIQLDPRNGSKFKDVCSFLEEDLRKMEKSASRNADPDPPSNN